MLLILIGTKGYSQDTIPSIGGPETPTHSLERVSNQKSIIAEPQFLSNYTNWKRKIKKKHGITYGASAIILHQYASKTKSDTHIGFGGVYRIMGSWEVIGRGTGNTGRLEIKLENRSSFPNFISPMQLGEETDMTLLNSGIGYLHNFSTDLSIFSWVQGFNNNRAGIAIGRLGFDAYLDQMAFQTFSRAFTNRSLTLQATTPTTGIGALGIVAKGFISKKIWIGAQAYDANASNGTFNISTFKKYEWLSAIEIGFTPSFNRRKSDRIQFTYWMKDERKSVVTAKGNGWLVSASYEFKKKFTPFIRFGRNNGGGGVTASSSFSGGLEYKPKPYHAISIGGGWAQQQTVKKGNNTEAAFELSYYVQVMSRLSLMANIQYLIPNNHNTQTKVIGFRTIINL